MTSSIQATGVERPSLELSGDLLRHSLQAMITGSEAQGGIERYVAALKLKSTMFRQALGDGNASKLELETFKGLCTFMSTVRRRIGGWLDVTSFEVIRQPLVALLDESAAVDQRIEQFCQTFPADKKHRWVRDLAAEILHYADPERVPLMHRWVWDAKANTGVLREIWHGDDVDHLTIRIDDTYATFLMLREELSQFLTDNGFFRDVLYYIDILCAQVYAQYICEQGGTYLRTDFSAPDDAMQHTRRLLGLDGVKPGSGRTRLKSIDGEAFMLEDTKLLSGMD